MIVEFDKTIYDKDSIYSSVRIWKDFFKSINIKEEKNIFVITIENTNDIVYTCNEFCNFVLDLVSLKELGK